MYISVALIPDHATKIPALTNQIGGKVCASVLIMEISKGVVVVMCYHPHSGMLSSKIVRPTNFVLISICLVQEFKKGIWWIWGEIEVFS